MRTALYRAGTLAAAAAFSPDMVRSAVAGAASALFESVPFLFAGLVAARLLSKHRSLVDFLGCGCGTGPSARSVPAAAATSLLFGPLVGAARFAAALLVARCLRSRRHCIQDDAPPQPLAELAALLSSSLVAGVAFALFSSFDPGALSPPGEIAVGLVLGFCAAPCGLGAVAVAGALRVRAPLAAAAFLCVAGIVDLRAFCRPAHRAATHDALAYAMLAGALALVAWRHGDSLVRPSIGAALGACAIVVSAYAVVFRSARSWRARSAPALMLAGAVAGAAPPSYRATETTLADLYPGERLSFTGRLTREDSHAALVRYAITCCRADAAPVVIRLASAPHAADGTWLRVTGSVEETAGRLALAPVSITPIAPPSDPFIYR